MVSLLKKGNFSFFGINPKKTVEPERGKLDSRLKISGMTNTGGSLKRTLLSKKTSLNVLKIHNDFNAGPLD